MTTTKILAIAAAAFIGLTAFASTADAATWKTVVTKKGSGAFTVKSFYRTLPTPTQVRLVSRSTTGTTVSWTISCVRGWDVTAKSGTWNARAGARVKNLPVMPGAESCDVVAAVGTRGITNGRFILQLQRTV